VKTTLEVPDALLRHAEWAAAKQGIPFGELVSPSFNRKANQAARIDKITELHSSRLNLKIGSDSSHK
jgi:hypothetical protein